MTSSDFIIYLGSMSATTTIRISKDTHLELRRVSTRRGETTDETVRRALRALRQDDIARELAQNLTLEDDEWLDADAG